MASESYYQSIVGRIHDLADVGRVEEAKALCRKAAAEAEAAGAEAFVHCFRGLEAYCENEDLRALEEQQKAADLDPLSPSIQTEFGGGLEHVGRFPDALRAADTALALQPGYVRALLVRARCLDNMGDAGGAGAALDEADSLDPQGHRTPRIRAMLLHRVGRLDQALIEIERSLSRQPRCAATLRDRAFLLHGAGRRNEAWESLKEASAIRPNSPAVRGVQALLLHIEGRYAEAITLFDGVLKANTWDPLARANRAVCLGLAGRRVEAVEELRRLAAEWPADWPIGRFVRSWLVRFSEPQQAQELISQQVTEDQRRREVAREESIRLDAWRKLSARTAHRVGNQLFAARGALRTLKERGDPTLPEVCDIERGLDRIGRICTEFRRFSTDEQPKLRAVDVSAMLREVVRRFTGSAETIGMSASLPALLPECRWDPQQIEQAVTELLENAIRHTPGGRKVDLAAEPVERDGRQYVRIVVRNDGQGVEARYKARIFEPFFSLTPGGTGLGLAIVSQIIQNHKGTIRETGEHGEFARFEVELPARPFEESHDEGSCDRR